MRIQHNIMAMSAYRNYTNNVSAMQKNLEKLSSGYKINRAGDDAAGLAISEKMRAQITGLETAQKNAKDGISLVKTAEGALSEVHDMLNRMVELATQSANGTYEDDTDREQLQKEIEQLQAEIDRISKASNFNGRQLLDGSMDQGGGKVKGDFLIPEEGNPLGDNTYTHGSGTSKAKTEFELHLDTLEINPTEAGAKLEVDIGGNKVTLDLTKDTKYDTAKLATEIAAAFNKSADTKKIGGQEFEITADTAKGVVKFVQKNDPTSDAEVVDGSMDVKLTYTPKTGGTATVLSDDPVDGGYMVYEATPGTINSENAKTDIELIAQDGETPAVTGTIAAGADLATVLDSKTAVDGDISVEYAEGKWTISVGADQDKVSIEATAEYSDGVLTLKSENSTLLTITASNKEAEGLAEGKFTAAFETGSATATGLTYAAGKTEGGGNENEGGGDDNKTETVTGTMKITGLTDLDPDAATSSTQITAADASSINTWLATAKVTVDGHEISLAGATQLATTGSATVNDLAQSIGAVVKAELAKATDATYSDIKVSIGNASDIAVQTGGDDVDISVTATKAAKQGGGTTTTAGGVSGNYNASTVNIKQGAAEQAGSYASTKFELSQLGTDIGDGSTVTIGENTYTFKLGDSFSVSGTTITLDKNATATERLEQAGDGLSQMTNTIFSIGHEGGGKIVIDELKGNQKELDKLATREGINSLLSYTAVTPKDESKGLVLQIGDTDDDYNQLKVSIGATDCKSLGIDGIDISKQGSAQSAIDQIKDAINKVSDIRGTLGATQNRLDHTINNLSVMTENIQDAESTIRDVDVAEEMMAYTKNNILIQSAQAMLAQANQVPQGVLQLLG